MASNDQPPFDPYTQTINMTLRDGTQLPLSIPVINEVNQSAISTSVNYAVQAGACIVMLAVVLTMTPKKRFGRLPTILSILALTLNIIRMLLLIVYFTSQWFDFYTFYSLDRQRITQMHLTNSVAATVLSIPITLVLETALMVQAWSMLRLWPNVYKLVATAASGIIVTAVVVCCFANAIEQSQFILMDPPPMTAVTPWQKLSFLITFTVSIIWFCFLFIARLVIHMWQTRSLLPSISGLKPVDVLVITNGLLMLLPGTLPSSFQTCQPS